MNITKEFLLKHYTNTHRTMEEVGKMVGCTGSTIKNRLVNFGLHVKNNSEVRIGRFRKTSEQKRQREKLTSHKYYKKRMKDPKFVFDSRRRGLEQYKREGK